MSTRTTASSDSISSPQIPLDPWSLGPDVFALTSHSQMVVDDTVQRDQSVVEDQAEPKVAVESLESSRKLSAPDATSNAELPVSTSGLQMPNSDIADSGRSSDCGSVSF
ncbi:MAG: hypothetical protein IPP40_03130 [bacterium]|nr:hypothetical protein [bacterium]